jgi:hypothetical protein
MQNKKINRWYDTYLVAVTQLLILSSCVQETNDTPPATRIIVFESSVYLEPSNLAPDCTADAVSDLALSTVLDMTHNGQVSTLSALDGVFLRDGRSTQISTMINSIEVEVDSDLCLVSNSTLTNGEPGTLSEERFCLPVEANTNTMLFAITLMKGTCSIKVSAFATVQGAISSDTNSPAKSNISDFYHGVVFDKNGKFTLKNIFPDCEEVEVNAEGEIDTTITARASGTGSSGDALLLSELSDATFEEGQEASRSMPFEWLEGVEGGTLCLSSSGTEEKDLLNDDWLEEDEQCANLSLEQPRMDFELNMTRGACTLTFQVSATWYGEKARAPVETPIEMGCGDMLCVGDEPLSCPRDCRTSGICDVSATQNHCIQFSGEAWSDPIAESFCNTIDGGMFVTGDCGEPSTGFCVVQELLRDDNGDLVPDTFAHIIYYGSSEENYAHCVSVGGFYPSE